MVINTTKLYLFLLFPPPLQNLPFICFPVPLGIFHVLPRTFTYLNICPIGTISPLPKTESSHPFEFRSYLYK